MARQRSRCAVVRCRRSSPARDRPDAPAVAIDRTRTIGPAARRRGAVTNFVAGQFGSGNERLDQEMSRMVASSQ